LGLPDGVLKLEQSQAAAAVGQISLARAYAEGFSAHGLTTAQVLLTLGDTEERRRYLNARNTMQTLLGLNAVPIVNENDTVATSEIRYGDNDRLAARVAAMIDADALILLSDVDGLYTAPPAQNPDAEHLPLIKTITPQIEAMAGGAASIHSRGGMATKLQAAKIATSAGVDMFIASGEVLAPLSHMQNVGKSTLFKAAGTAQDARKRFIGGILVPTGTLVIDAGAQKALYNGKSLLPAGVKACKGAFVRGDAVKIESETGVELGRGLVAYDHSEASLIIGKTSDQIPSLLGYEGRSAIIHRDDLVLSTNRQQDDDK
jgi:glutamate 5-kinase